MTNKDNRTFMEKIKDDLGQSAIAGLVAVGITHLALDINVTSHITVFGNVMPVYAALFGTVAIADAVAYAGHDFVIEKIPMLQQYANEENRIAAPVLSGIATYTLLMGAVSSNTAFLTSFGLGAGSSIAGRYGYDMIINKM